MIMSEKDCIVACKTINRRQRVVRIHRTFVPETNDIKSICDGAMKLLKAHKNFNEFLGCGIDIFTPNGDYNVILDCYWGKYFLTDDKTKAVVWTEVE